MPAPAFDRTLLRQPRTTDPDGLLYVPELAPVVLPPGGVMTRPWLDWARRLTAKLAELSTGSGGGGGTGDVVGPAGATPDALALYDGGTGKRIKDSLTTVAQLVTQAVNAAIAAILPGGTLPPAALPPNIAFTDRTNMFAESQALTRAGSVGVAFTDGSQPANARRFDLVNDTQGLRVWARADDGAVLSAPFYVDRVGNVGVGNNLNVPGTATAVGGLGLGGVISQTMTRPFYVLIDASQPANLKRWDVVNEAQDFIVEAWNDAGSTGVIPLRLKRNGDVNVARTLNVGLHLNVSGASGNVALRNSANTFASMQTFQAVTWLDAPQPEIIWYDNDAAADNRRLSVIGYNGQLMFRTQADAGTLQLPILQLTRAGHALLYGDYYEKNRATPMGHWIAVGYSAANFGGLGGMTWTVEAGDVQANRYMLVGKTLIWTLQINTSTVGGTPDYLLTANIPAGFTLATMAPLPAAFAVSGGVNVRVMPIIVSGTQIGFQQETGANWSGTNTVAVWATVIIEVV